MDNHGYTPLHLVCSSQESMLFDLRQIKDRHLDQYNILRDYSGLLRLRRAWGPDRHRSYMSDDTEENTSAAAVELLLAAGATATIKAKGVYTPMHCAANSDWLQVVKLLVVAGAPVYTGPACSPVCWASSTFPSQDRVSSFWKEKLGPQGAQRIAEHHERQGLRKT